MSGRSERRLEGVRRRAAHLAHIEPTVLQVPAVVNIVTTHDRLYRDIAANSPALVDPATKGVVCYRAPTHLTPVAGRGALDAGILPWY